MPYIITLAVMAALLLGVNAEAQTRKRQALQYLGETTGVPVADDGRSPYRLPASALPHDSATLLSQLLEKQPKGTKVWQHAIFLHNGEPGYLAVVWNMYDAETPPYGRQLQIYRLVRNSDKLEPVLVVEKHEEHVSIVEPSGSDPYGEGAGLLFVDFGSGGTGFQGYSQHIFRLDAVLTEITPREYGRPILADELEPGHFTVIASDDRWGNYFAGCGQCGPLIPVVLRRENGRYVEACSAHPGYYDVRIAWRLEKIANREERHSVEEFLSNRTELMLNYIQSGRLVEARRHFDEMASGSATLLQERSEKWDAARRAEGARYRERMLGRIVSDFEPVLAAAEASSRPCRLRAYTGAGSNAGRQDRINRTRPQ
ncbi:MAG: hypothetical protein KG075_24505 [Alphaproteobacteria bacterium]|nr:hypothetical protein [Alphaproteobacteria bacterium]